MALTTVKVSVILAPWGNIEDEAYPRIQRGSGVDYMRRQLLKSKNEALRLSPRRSRNAG